MRHTPIVALDHLTVPVRDLRKARAFYEAALGALGMRVNAEWPGAVGLGSKKQLIFWLGRERKASGGGHYALRVDHRHEVDAFHAAALAAGGEDHGAPGLRPDYGRHYYAAFVLDPDGNNLEVVCYRPPERSPARRAGKPAGKPAPRAGKRAGKQDEG